MANKDLFVLVFAHEHELEIEIEIEIVFELDKAKLRSKNCQKTGGQKFEHGAQKRWGKGNGQPKNDRRGIKPRRAV